MDRNKRARVRADQPPMANTIGTLVFMDHNSGTVRVRQRKTPGGGALMMRINCDPIVNAAIEAALQNDTFAFDYDRDPISFENNAAALLESASPALVRALQYAATQHPALLHVTGLPFSQGLAPTPLDGVVDQAAVSVELRLFIGAAAAMGFNGFGYASENKGRLLRSVSPVSSHQEEANSQGAADLGFHADNADLPIPNAHDLHPGAEKPMNQWQGFVTVRPKRGIPMRVVVTADVVRFMYLRGWQEHYEQLMAPEFRVKAPASHGDAPGIADVPVLVETHFGGVASRYHASNVQGQSDEAKVALAAFASALNASRSEIIIPGRRGDLLFYQNPLCLHRRQAFTPAYDGEDRMYVRVYFDTPESLLRFRSDLACRVF